MHDRRGTLNLGRRACELHKVETGAVQLHVGAAEPCALATDDAVRRRHGHVLVPGQLPDLLDDAPLPMQPRAGKRENEGSSRLGAGTGAIARHVIATSQVGPNFCQRLASLANMDCMRKCCFTVVVVGCAWAFAIAYCAFLNAFDERSYIKPQDLKWPGQS